MSIMQDTLNALRTDALLKKQNLYITRNAIALWEIFLNMHSTNEALIKEGELLIEAAAKREWGSETACSFDRELGTLMIEHFDGRKILVHINVNTNDLVVNV